MSSIGIIGGADGPTKVFVSGVFVSGQVWPWIAGVAAIALVLFLLLRRKK